MVWFLNRKGLRGTRWVSVGVGASLRTAWASYMFNTYHWLKDRGIMQRPTSPQVESLHIIYTVNVTIKSHVPKTLWIAPLWFRFRCRIHRQSLHYHFTLHSCMKYDYVFSKQHHLHPTCCFEINFNSIAASIFSAAWRKSRVVEWLLIEEKLICSKYNGVSIYIRREINKLRRNGLR